MAQVPVFFISSTTHDLGSYRETVAQALRDRELQVVVMDHFAPDHRQIGEMLRHKLAPCDAVVCLVGFHYGAEPPGGGSPRRSYTQWEYFIARDLRKPVYLLFARETTPWDRPPDEPAEKRQLQLEFRQHLVGTGQRRDAFSSKEQLRDLALRIPIHGRRTPVLWSWAAVVAAGVAGLALWLKPWSPRLAKAVEEQPEGEGRPVTVLEASREIPFINGLKMRFLPLPGAPVGGPLLSVWETRTSDWNAAGLEAGTIGEPDEPVCGVSPRAAVDFCRWLTEQERRKGLIPARWTYRLPTVDEWTAATVKPDGSVPLYPWGDAWPPAQRLANLRGGSNDLPEDGYRELAPVGSLLPNGNGFHDLAGNVWEICTRSPEPPVIRGGSHQNSQQRVLRLDFLAGVSADPSYAQWTGFRCLLAPEE